MKLLKTLLAGFVLCSLFLLPFAAQAQSTTAERYQIISGHCQNLRNQIDQLQRRDLVSRTNLGREFESIDNQLNAFNQRIHNNNLDNQAFTQLVTQLDAQVNQFRDEYVHYDDSLNKLQQIDCQKSPADFDNQLNQSRMLREATQDDVQKAYDITTQYRDQATALQMTLPDKQGNGK